MSARQISPLAGPLTGHLPAPELRQKLAEPGFSRGVAVGTRAIGLLAGHGLPIAFIYVRRVAAIGREIARDRRAVDMWRIFARFVPRHGLPFGRGVGLGLLACCSHDRLGREGVFGARHPDFLAARAADGAAVRT